MYVCSISLKVRVYYPLEQLEKGLMHMYKNSTFGEILKLLNKEIVTRAVQDHKSDKYSKGFNTWNQLVAMLFGQFGECKSLRDLEIRLNAKPQTHYHLGSIGVHRSTLSDANRNRNSEVFRDIANAMIRKQNEEIKDVVSLIDSSMIRVDGRGYDWTETTKTRCGKGLKLHIKCTGQDQAIEHMSITGTNVNDITETQQWSIQPHKIYVFDKGYADFNWWYKIAITNSYFVTRVKKNTAYKIVETLNISTCSERVQQDYIIELTNKNPRGGKKNLLASQALRLVEIYDKKSDKSYKFISNLMQASADEIADHYKQRWGIELLFKWLKQNLKVTKFLAENENAIKIQIYVAIIAYILIRIFQALYAHVFKRTIDLLSWIRCSILSNHTYLIPPNKTTDTPTLPLFAGIL